MVYKSSRQSDLLRFFSFHCAKYLKERTPLIPEHTQQQEVNMSKDKPAQKSIPEFKFNSNDEKLALTANDMDIYPQLGIFNQAMWSNQEHYPHKLYHNDVRFTRSHEQPDMLPVTINGLGEFHDGINDINGFWSVFWFSDRLSSNDFVYGDEFRRVVVFGSMELAIRPVQYDGEIPRIL